MEIQNYHTNDTVHITCTHNISTFHTLCTRVYVYNIIQFAVWWRAADGVSTHATLTHLHPLPYTFYSTARIGDLIKLFTTSVGVTSPAPERIYDR